jgi:hypothetical protein
MEASQIVELGREAAEAGDLRMTAICVLALSGPSGLDGAEPGTDFAILAAEGRDQRWAEAQCRAALQEGT